jgi:hypothetical protein
MKKRTLIATTGCLTITLAAWLMAAGYGNAAPDASASTNAPVVASPQTPAVETPKAPATEPETNAVPPPVPSVPLKPGALQAGMRIECPAADPSIQSSVLAVCRDVGWVYETQVGCEPPLGGKPIVIRKDPVPRACLNWLPQEYGINITGPDTTLYCQIVFQLAHEMGHVFIDPYKGGWFSESVANAMIYVCLDALAEKWKTNPPYANWVSYAPNFASYSAEDQASHLRYYNLKSTEDAHAWVKTNLPETIRKGDFDRPMQFVSALVLWDIFKQHPKSLGAIVKLGEATGNDGAVDFLKWRQLVMPEQQPLVDAIAGEFTFPGVWPVKAPPPNP